jgi:hypothetical protein
MDPLQFPHLASGINSTKLQEKNNKMEMITIAGPGTQMANHLNQGIRLYG